MFDSARKKEIRHPLSVDVAASIIHGLGFCLSIAGLAALVAKAASGKGVSALIGVSLWGAALMYHFLSSTLLHALSRTHSAPIFRVLDHTGEYFAVAAAFAPLCLMPDRGFMAYLAFGGVWVAAVFGITFSSVYFGRFRYLPLALLAALAWLLAISLPVFRLQLPAAFPFLSAGWFVYLVGTIFYMDEKSPAAHIVWHSLSFVANLVLFVGVYLTVGA
jgi:hemolysin III